MNMYSINLENHFKPLFSVLLTLLAITLLLYWFNFAQFMIVMCGIYFLIDFPPAAYLHLEYWNKNRGEKYAVTEQEIVRYTVNQKEVYKAEDIENCIIYRSASVDKGSWVTFLSMEEYYYARLLLRTGDELIITCLLMPKMDHVLGQLQGIQFTRKKRAINPLGWR